MSKQAYKTTINQDGFEQTFIVLADNQQEADARFEEIENQLNYSKEEA